MNSFSVLPPPPARSITEDQVTAALDNPEEIDLGGEEEEQVEVEGHQQHLEHHGALAGKEKQGETAMNSEAGQHDGRALEDDPMFKPIS
jgi:hypothetical protein